MQNDSRREAQRLLGLFRFSQVRTLVTTAGCVVFAAAIALGPTYDGLSEAGHRALFVLLFAAGMWVTEAIPAFATSLLAIGLLIALLGRPDGVFATGPKDWEMFIAPWGSSLIWLFFGGFCLALSAEKTGLDRRLAVRALSFFGRRPGAVLLGVMLVTAVLSMFVSNTATATLVLAMMTPVFASRPRHDRVSKALAVGVAMAANVGGMGTVIGTPPNAIAAGLLNESSPVNFAQWMLIAIPPAVLLLAIAWVYLVVVYLRREAFVESGGVVFQPGVVVATAPQHQRVTTMLVFAATVGLWLTSPFHPLPTTVVSFLPITALTATGILTGEDIRRLPWDILLLITGGLSLGVAMKETGLAAWAVGQLPIDTWSAAGMAIGFGYLAVVMSNLMSNTATANLVLPIVIAVLAGAGDDERLAVPVALAASAAMCLPISTPPNAIVYGSGHIRATDLIGGGLVIGVIAPPVATVWTLLVLGWL